MSELPTIQKGQFRKKSQKGGEMEVKNEGRVGDQLNLS